jgi:hypothetical protein
MPAFPTPRTTLFTAGASALVATGLWVASGFLNRFLLLHTGRVPDQVVRLVAPSAMDFRLGSGSYRISAAAAVACVLLTLVVAGLTLLAVFRLQPGHGRMTLFLATWFAAVAGSFVASTVQVLGFASELGPLPGSERLSLLVPSITSGSYWGVALGWLVGATAVITFSLSARGTDVEATW